MHYSYFPGCSLHSTASEYDDSVQAVFAALGVELHEIEDWNCCGATSAHSLNRSLALSLPARNLAIAQRSGSDLVLPCAACFNRHKATDFELRNHPARRAYLEQVVGFSFDGSVAVRPLLDVVGNDIGLEAICSRVARPLHGLHVVSYYGCLLVRPPDITQFEDPENPILMDRLLEALGAHPLPWSYATECCGGGLSLTRPGLAARMVSRLAEQAREAGAQAIVTSCPLCQVNLEMRQPANAPGLPIFYFTELIGLAFCLEKADGWWNKHLIDPRPLLCELPAAGRH